MPSARHPPTSSIPLRPARHPKTGLQLQQSRLPTRFRLQLRRIAPRRHGSDQLVARDKTLVAMGDRREAGICLCNCLLSNNYRFVGTRVPLTICCCKSRFKNLPAALRGKGSLMITTCVGILNLAILLSRNAHSSSAVIVMLSFG